MLKKYFQASFGHKRSPFFGYLKLPEKINGRVMFLFYSPLPFFGQATDLYAVTISPNIKSSPFSDFENQLNIQVINDREWDVLGGHMFEDDNYKSGCNKNVLSAGTYFQMPAVHGQKDPGDVSKGWTQVIKED